MTIDTNLVLDPGQTVTADGNTSPITVEGGGLRAWCVVQTGTMTGASTTLDIRVQYSPDLGSNYYMLGKFQILGPTNDNALLRIPIVIPPSTTQPNPVYVRLNYDVSGSSPSYAITKAWLEPDFGNIPATDLSLAEGSCSKIAST